MTRPTLFRAFFGGVLVANSVPHVGSGLTGHRHLTPVGGRKSGPGINLAWGLANAAAGWALLRTVNRGGDHRWDASLVAFETGAASWALWSAGSEWLLKTNWSRSGGRFQTPEVGA